MGGPVNSHESLKVQSHSWLSSKRDVMIEVEPEILCGKDSTCQFCLALKIKERDYGPRNVVVSKSWEWPAAGSQQEHTRSSTTSKN